MRIYARHWDKNIKHLVAMQEIFLSKPSVHISKESSRKSKVRWIWFSTPESEVAIGLSLKDLSTLRAIINKYFHGHTQVTNLSEDR